MKKFIALASVGVGAAVGTAYAAHTDEFAPFLANATRAAERLWTSIEANPMPVLAALGTFLLTIMYHKLKGKSLRESVEVAATRVHVVAVPAPAVVAEPLVVKRAQARATRTQLIADQIALENRIRTLPATVKQAEKDACYTEQSVLDSEKALVVKRQAILLAATIETFLTSRKRKRRTALSVAYRLVKNEPSYL